MPMQMAEKVQRPPRQHLLHSRRRESFACAHGVTHDVITTSAKTLQSSTAVKRNKH